MGDNFADVADGESKKRGEGGGRLPAMILVTGIVDSIP